MHAIRRQAHRVASTSTGDRAHFNPFARARSRDVAVLEEAALNHSHSDGHAIRVNEGDLEPPQRAHTDPGPLLVQSVGQPDLESIAKSDNVKKTSDKTSDIITGRLTESRPTDENDNYDERRSYELMTPSEIQKLAFKRKIPLAQQLRTIFGSWMNLLLPLVPAGFAVKYANTNTISIFCINFIAIIPTAIILSFATEEVAVRTGDKIGALLNMTFGNAVQLIMSILLLKSKQVDVLKFSLLGNIMSNLLLTTGLSFLLGGLNRLEQYYNAAMAQTISMLLLLAVVSLVIPTAAHLMTDIKQGGIISQSRGTSVIIIFSYVLWLFFQLKTHRSIFKEPSPKSAKIKSKEIERGIAKGIAHIGAATAAATGGQVVSTKMYGSGCEEDEDEIKVPNLSFVGAIATLLISVVLVAFNTQFATDSIQGLLEHNLSPTFLGLVILPLLSNDPTAIMVAIQDKMDISIALTLERCMQTSLLIVPLTVLLAWCMGVDEMTLEFQGFSIAALFASIIIVTYVVQEGKSNWLTGALLIKVFLIIALAAFYIT